VKGRTLKKVSGESDKLDELDEKTSDGVHSTIPDCRAMIKPAGGTQF
jgi:hypothetical protein